MIWARHNLDSICALLCFKNCKNNSSEMGPDVLISLLGVGGETTKGVLRLEVSSVGRGVWEAIWGVWGVCGGVGGVCGTACTGVGGVLVVVVVVVVVVGVASFVVVPAFGDDEDDENATARTPARTTEEAITTDLFSGSLMKAKALLSDAERLSIFFKRLQFTSGGCEATCHRPLIHFWTPRTYKLGFWRQCHRHRHPARRRRHR